jgi:N-acetylglucosamine malate deacetylase 1
MSNHPPAPRLVAVMAHPDDVEIEIGGTLFHLKSLGWDLGIITMTAGDCGSATLRNEEIARVRCDEARAAANYLGASYACVGLMDVEVFTNAENLRKVVEVLRAFNPDVVITHSPVDYMLDHEETSRLVRGATFAIAIRNYQTRQGVAAKIARATPALYYGDPQEGIDPLGHSVYAQFYVDISNQLSNKREMLACHASQREWLRTHHGMDEYLDRVTAWAAKYGQECGVAYAEGFRQHLGHAYPREPILQNALAAYVHERQTRRTRGESR